MNIKVIGKGITPRSRKLIAEMRFTDDIAVIDDKYIVTTKGEVFTIWKNRKGIKKQKLRLHSNGYIRATLYQKDVYVHRLVAFCFIENPNGYKEISHEDNDKSNNHVENLKWCTRQYNNKKMFIDGIRTKEEMTRLAHLPKYKNRRFSQNEVGVIKRMIAEGSSDTQIALRFDCSRGAIYQIRKNKTYRSEPCEQPKSCLQIS